MLLRTCRLSAFALVATASPVANRPTAIAPPKTVAVLYFDNNTGKRDYDPLGKGISSMMISDLSSVPEIKLVERDRMQDLIKEVDAQHTTYFDSTTSVKVGKMVGAQFVVIGAFAEVDPKMRIDTRVVNVATGEIVKSAQVTGDPNKFFDMEQTLANKLIAGLGIALSPEEQQKLKAQQDANRVDALSTMNNYSQALALYDRSDYVGATTKMAPALKASPNSLFMHEAFAEAKRRSSTSATDKAKEKLKNGINGLFKRPPGGER